MTSPPLIFVSWLRAGSFLRTQQEGLGLQIVVEHRRRDVV